MKKRKTPNKIKRTLAGKSPEETSAIFLSSGVDIKNRTICLFDDIDSETVGMVIKGIIAMLQRGNSRITLYINSFGGCCYSAFGLYDFIKSVNCIVRTINLGSCMSAGAIIFLSGDERLMYENAVFMVHTVSSFAEGKVNLDLKSEKEECDRLQKQMNILLSENTNKSEKQWARLIRYEDVYYRKSKAINIGLVDEVIEKKALSLEEFCDD